MPSGLPSFVRGKIHDYLLSPTHRRGRSKHRFFAAPGYSRHDWTRLAEDLRRHLAEHPVTLSRRNSYGAKYVVRGTIRGPSGTVAGVVTVWIILATEDFPRFVTAYPGERP